MLKHLGPNPAVDIIVHRQHDSEKQILLIQRSEKSEAFPNKWALPGGFVDSEAKKGEIWIEGKESKVDAAKRELLEETGLNLHSKSHTDFHFKGIYDSIDRDPRNTSRAWTESHVFMIGIDELEGRYVTGMDDAQNALWFTVSQILKMKNDLGFDHFKILEDSGVLE